MLIVRNLSRTILAFTAALTLTQAGTADPSDTWVRRWNAEPGREIKLEQSELLFKESDNPKLSQLIAAGFQQSDGSYSLGRIIWGDESYTPLTGFGVVLSDLNFASLSDQERTSLFLGLLQETYGSLGTKPYTGPTVRATDRPRPLVGLRGPDDSHRFQVWYYEFPVQAEEGEWREVLYVVSPDGKDLKARTLGAYHPVAERLRDFPQPSEELFE